MDSNEAKAYDQALEATKLELTRPLSMDSISQDYQLGLAQSAVMSFMIFAGQQVRVAPTAQITPEEKARIGKVFSEEFREFFEAMENNDLQEVVDGLADIIYVALSIACTYGVYLPPIIREVCGNNHLKTLSPKRLSPEGKLLKPDGHPKPRINELLALMAKYTQEALDGQ